MTSWKTRTVLVAGGAGEVGEGITLALLRLGARVVVPSRSKDKLTQLSEAARGAPGELVSVHADVTTDRGLEETKRHVNERLDGVVASFGGFWHGPRFVELDPAAFDEVLVGSLVAHARFARAFLPALQPGGAYLALNGPAALFALAGSSPLSVSAAAQLMLTRVLIAEATDQSPRIGSLVIGNQVQTRSVPTPPAPFLRVEEVAQTVVDWLDSGRGHGVQRLAKTADGVELGELSTA